MKKFFALVACIGSLTTSVASAQWYPPPQWQPPPQQRWYPQQQPPSYQPPPQQWYPPPQQRIWLPQQPIQIVPPYAGATPTYPPGIQGYTEPPRQIFYYR